MSRILTMGAIAIALMLSAPLAQAACHEGSGDGAEALLDTILGVEFSPEQEDNALRAANQAPRALLEHAGIQNPQLSLLLQGRRWANLDELAETEGIGPETLEKLRTLGTAYPEGEITITKENAPFLVREVQEICWTMEARLRSIRAMLNQADISTDGPNVPLDDTYNNAVTVRVLNQVQQNVAGFVNDFEGKSFESREKAIDQFKRFASTQLQLASQSYPLSVVAFVDEPLPLDQRVARGKDAVYNWFGNQVATGDEWADIGGGASWADAKDGIRAQIDNIDTSEGWKQIRAFGCMRFTGTVAGRKVTFRVDDVGLVTEVEFLE